MPNFMDLNFMDLDFMDLDFMDHRRSTVRDHFLGRDHFMGLHLTTTENKL